ncbi:hypothetical protein CDD82_2399 [Ophiocordyceps australis]|uniref:Uncharacterized protein n=1 Tax=Ophiocordyceps australis TaxID=1399860 RepID=A0A2C5XWS7_9HYPO|nr:hypothetical protein CDD82_2399 [Ophiocordyceps australis]
MTTAEQAAFTVSSSAWTMATTQASASGSGPATATPMVPWPATQLDGDVDLRSRVLELVSGGTAGDKIVRGFLIGVALGLVVGGVCCCWVPCFGRRAQRERRQRRRRARRRERDATEPSRAAGHEPTRLLYVLALPAWLSWRRRAGREAG